jgi:EAL domain-containing protein (putative c-di-GMP-specific phosphodiesterase class I)
MPLSHLIFSLNNKSALSSPASRLSEPFFSINGRVYLLFANIRLESVFLPIVDTHSGEIHGHAAGLCAIGMKRKCAIDPATVFVLPTDDEEFIRLDRLVRTLHALNYLTHRVRGNLLLKVHPRHVASVPTEHGLAFEEILRPCGLLPEQITLEIDTSRIECSEHLIGATQNYKSRGFSIAVSHFGRKGTDFELLEKIAPSLVKFDRHLWNSESESEAAIKRIHTLGGKVLIKSLNTQALRQGANFGEIDLLQAYQPLRTLRHVGSENSANLTVGAAA